MGFVSAKCPACAKSVEIPAEETEFFCPYCGSKFLRDAAYAFAAMPELATGDGDLSDFAIIGSTLTTYTGTKPNVIIPAHVTVIASKAFQGNKHISSIVIPDSVTAIKDSAFRDCTSLRKVTMSNSIVTIAFSAFEDCASLQEINLPRSLKLIGDSAFNGCSSLTTIPIPSSCDYTASGELCPSFPTRVKLIKI